MFSLHGNGVGAGIAIGTAHVIHQDNQHILQYEVPPAEIDNEIQRLTNATQRAITALNSVYQFNKNQNDEVLAIIEAHIVILEDSTLINETSQLIRSYGINAEDALSRYNKKIVASFSQITDPHLSSKSIDIEQVVDAVQAELKNEHSDNSILDDNYDNKIIVAHDLSPADTIAFAKHNILAFVTSLGSPISHTAILARSMEIPAIVGLHDVTQYIRTGDSLIIDGRRGVVLAHADQKIIDSYQQRREKIQRRNQDLASLTDAESLTLDGVAITLTGNIEFEQQLASVIKNSAQGIGLYRTEFLFMDSNNLPDEQQQYVTYNNIFKYANGAVTIRTLDLGADKQIDGGRNDAATKVNPALGRRGIRLCLHDLDLFKPQLRAIFRAAVNHDVRILIPMVSSIDELKQLFTLMTQIKRELSEENIEFNNDIPIGAMIEVPAAAIVAPIFAHHFDFFSIGTNDLIQYALAIDRIDDEVNYLYDPLHPAILQLIKYTVEAAKTANIPVSMCGEMASDTQFTRLLLGIGLTDFSMDASAILQVKQQVRLTNIAKIRPLVEKVLCSQDSNEIKSLVESLNA